LGVLRASEPREGGGHAADLAGGRPLVDLDLDLPGLAAEGARGGVARPRDWLPAVPVVEDIQEASATLGHLPLRIAVHG
jgi:hypothetical protein